MRIGLNLACVLLIIPLLVVTSAVAQNSSPNKALGKDYNVDVDRAVVYENKGHPLFSIHYTFEFKNRKTVFVKGLGWVPGTGEFEYFSPYGQIEFLQSEDGPLIVTVPIRETLVLMGPPTTAKLPEESEFAAASRPGDWPDAASFKIHASRVFGMRFPSGYKAYEEGDHVYWISTYSSLDGTPKNLFGEVAVLLSYSRSAHSGPISFDVRASTLESRSHSPEWLAPETVEVQQSATKFMDQLLKELQQP